jgi:NADH-quinone oxidoreductase subunit J
MNALFYTAAAVALLSTLQVITHRNPMHALLYLIVSLLAVAVVFFTLGAPLVAALEVIIYAGAIMVLFVFVIMMLSPGAGEGGPQARARLLRACAGPALLALVLLGELAYALGHSPAAQTGPPAVGPKAVAASLFGPYLLGVELASILLLGALVGAYHLARRGEPAAREEEEV